MEPSKPNCTLLKYFLSISSLAMLFSLDLMLSDLVIAGGAVTIGGGGLRLSNVIPICE